MSHRKLHLFYLIYGIFVILLLEFSLRVFYAVRFANPSIISSPHRMLERYYPGLEACRAEHIIRNNGTIDILLLGGSVLHRRWGRIEQELQQKLLATYPCGVNIHNMAIPAHTSLDSRIKYDLLHDKQYDIILLYHGINDVRLNNCPPEVFAHDYSHLPFYQQVSAINTTMGRLTVLPYTFSTLRTRLLQLSGRDSFLSRKATENQAWLHHGKDIKTDSAFQANYQAIISAAVQRQTAVIAPTFAYYVPADYSPDSFRKKITDYSGFRSPIEIWGDKNHVVKGIEAHNRVIKALSRAVPPMENLYVVDMNQALTKKGSNFDDICHLTAAGSAEYASIIYTTFRAIIDKNRICQPRRKALPETPSVTSSKTSPAEATKTAAPDA